MPLNMIRKSAIVNAQREAFPETLGALYTEDDALTQTEPKDVTQHVQEEIKQHANSEVLDMGVDYETDEIPIEEPQPEPQPEPVTSNGPDF